MGYSVNGKMTSRGSNHQYFGSAFISSGPHPAENINDDQDFARIWIQTHQNKSGIWHLKIIIENLSLRQYGIGLEDFPLCRGRCHLDLDLRAVVGKLLLQSNGVTLLPLLEKLATFNPSPIFTCNGSVTVTSYQYFKCNETVTCRGGQSYLKK